MKNFDEKAEAIKSALKNLFHSVKGKTASILLASSLLVGTTTTTTGCSNNPDRSFIKKTNESDSSNEVFFIIDDFTRGPSCDINNAPQPTYEPGAAECYPEFGCEK